MLHNSPLKNLNNFVTIVAYYIVYQIRIILPQMTKLNDLCTRLRKQFENQNDWLTYALRFLLLYWITPHATTERTPSELLLGQNVHMCWDLLCPFCHSAVIKVQNQMQPAEKYRLLEIYDLVWVRDFRPKAKCTLGSRRNNSSFRTT